MKIPLYLVAVACVVIALACVYFGFGGFNEPDFSLKMRVAIATMFTVLAFATLALAFMFIGLARDKNITG